MLTAEEKERNDKLVLDYLIKSDGTKVDPVFQTDGHWWLRELINDEMFIQRNAMPEEIEAWRKREAIRQEEEEQRKDAAYEEDRLAAEKDEDAPPNIASGQDNNAALSDEAVSPAEGSIATV